PTPSVGTLPQPLPPTPFLQARASRVGTLPSPRRRIPPPNPGHRNPSPSPKPRPSPPSPLPARAFATLPHHPKPKPSQPLPLKPTPLPLPPLPQTRAFVNPPPLHARAVTATSVPPNAIAATPCPLLDPGAPTLPQLAAPPDWGGGRGRC
ncbi:hypothetical protein Salat_1451700, partial [Sesamum alatum]